MEAICNSHIGRKVSGKGEKNVHGYSFIICENVWNDHFYTFWTARKGPCCISPVWEKNSNSCLQSWLGLCGLVWGWKGLTNLDKRPCYALRMADGKEYQNNEGYFTKNGTRLERIEKDLRELKKTWENWKRLDRIEKDLTELKKTWQNWKKLDKRVKRPSWGLLRTILPLKHNFLTKIQMRTTKHYWGLANMSP